MAKKDSNKAEKRSCCFFSRTGEGHHLSDRGVVLVGAGLGGGFFVTSLSNLTFKANCSNNLVEATKGVSFVKVLAITLVSSNYVFPYFWGLGGGESIQRTLLAKPCGCI